MQVVGRICVADHQVHDLTPEEVSKGMEEGRYLLVDVREPNEVAVEAYPGGVVVPLCRPSIRRRFRTPRQAGGVRLPLGQALGDGVAGGAGGGPCPTTSISRAASLAGRRRDCRPRPAAEPFHDFHEQGLRRPSRHRLRGDVAGRARQQRHQSRPGLSRRSRAGGYPPRRGRRDGERLQPVPVDDGHSGTAAGDRGALRPLARPHRSIP